MVAVAAVAAVAATPTAIPGTCPAPTAQPDAIPPGTRVALTVSRDDRARVHRHARSSDSHAHARPLVGHLPGVVRPLADDGGIALHAQVLGDRQRGSTSNIQGAVAHHYDAVKTMTAVERHRASIHDQVQPLISEVRDVD